MYRGLWFSMIRWPENCLSFCESGFYPWANCRCSRWLLLRCLVGSKTYCEGFCGYFTLWAVAAGSKNGRCWGTLRFRSNEICSVRSCDSRRHVSRTHLETVYLGAGPVPHPKSNPSKLRDQGRHLWNNVMRCVPLAKKKAGALWLFEPENFRLRERNVSN